MGSCLSSKISRSESETQQGECGLADGTLAIAGRMPALREYALLDFAETVPVVLVG